MSERRKQSSATNVPARMEAPPTGEICPHDCGGAWSVVGRAFSDSGSSPAGLTRWQASGPCRHAEKPVEGFRGSTALAPCLLREAAAARLFARFVGRKGEPLPNGFDRCRLVRRGVAATIRQDGGTAAGRRRKRRSAALQRKSAKAEAGELPRTAGGNPNRVREARLSKTPTAIGREDRVSSAVLQVTRKACGSCPVARPKRRERKVRTRFSRRCIQPESCATPIRPAGNAGRTGSRTERYPEKPCKKGRQTAW